MNATRFPELAYYNPIRGIWRFVDRENNREVGGGRRSIAPKPNYWPILPDTPRILGDWNKDFWFTSLT